MGQMVEVIKAHAFRSRIGRAYPVELVGIGRAFAAVAIDEIDERASDAADGGSRESLAAAVVGFGAEFHGMLECVSGIHDAPCHRGSARAMLGNKACGERARLRIENVIDVTLLKDPDVLGPMAGHGPVAHSR